MGCLLNPTHRNLEMQLRAGKKIWIAILVLFLASVTWLYLLRREAYELNKNVRLVSWRIIQFGELARHRKLTYKIEFLKGRYKVLLLVSPAKDEWKEVASFAYENSLEPTIPGFTLVIQKGRIISYQWEGSQGKLRPAIVLGFFHPRNPSRQKGILFLEDGEWRTL